MSTNPPHRRRETLVVETDGFLVAQVGSGNIQVYNKHTGGMIMHVKGSQLFSKEKLQAFVDRIQADNEPSFDALWALGGMTQ